MKITSCSSSSQTDNATNPLSLPSLFEEPTSLETAGVLMLPFFTPTNSTSKCRFTLSPSSSPFMNLSPSSSAAMPLTEAEVVAAEGFEMFSVSELGSRKSDEEVGDTARAFSTAPVDDGRELQRPQSPGRGLWIRFKKEVCQACLPPNFNNCRNMFTKLKHSLCEIIADIFENYASFVYDNPCKVIWISLVIFCLLSIGLIYRTDQHDMIKLYTVANTQSDQVRHDLLSTFDRSRNVLILTASSQPLLSRSVLEDIRFVYDFVFNNLTVTAHEILGDGDTDDEDKWFQLKEVGNMGVARKGGVDLDRIYMGKQNECFGYVDWIESLELTNNTLYNNSSNIKHVFPGCDLFTTFPYKLDLPPNVVLPPPPAPPLPPSSRPASYYINRYDLSINYKDICVKEADQSCRITSVFDMYAYPRTSLGRVIPVRNYPEFVNVQTRKKVMADSVMANITAFRSSTGGVTLSNATGLMLYLSTNGNDDFLPYTMAWEGQLVEFVNLFRFNSSVEAEFYIYTERSINDELARASTIDFDIFIRLLIGFILLFGYTITVNTTTDIYATKTLSATVGACTALLGYAAGGGLFYILGFEHVPPADCTPFLVMGIGVDDVFVILNAYSLTYGSFKSGSKQTKTKQNLTYSAITPKQQSTVVTNAFTPSSASHYSTPTNCQASDPPLPPSPNESKGVRTDSRNRICQSMRDAGLAISITTVTNLIAFTVGACSPFYSITNFCAITALSLLFGYFSCLTVFLGVLCLEAKREEDARLDCSRFCGLNLKSRDSFISTGGKNDNTIKANHITDNNHSIVSELSFADGSDIYELQQSKHNKVITTLACTGNGRQEYLPSMYMTTPHFILTSPSSLMDRPKGDGERVIASSPKSQLILSPIQEDSLSVFELAALLVAYHEYTQRMATDRQYKSENKARDYQCEIDSISICPRVLTATDLTCSPCTVRQFSYESDVSPNRYLPFPSPHIDPLPQKKALNLPPLPPRKIGETTSLASASSPVSSLPADFPFKCCIEPKGNIGRVFRLFVLNYYSVLLATWWGQLAVLCAFVVYVSIGLWGWLVYMEVGLSYFASVSGQSYLRDFFNVREQYFDVYGEKVEVLFNDADTKWWDPRIQDELIWMQETLEAAKYTAVVSNGFHRFLKNKRHELKNDERDFVEKLQSWLDNNRYGQHYRRDFVFSPSLNGDRLKAWKLTFYQKYINDSAEAWQWLLQCRRDAGSPRQTDITPYHPTASSVIGSETTSSNSSSTNSSSSNSSSTNSSNSSSTNSSNSSNGSDSAKNDSLLWRNRLVRGDCYYYGSMVLEADPIIFSYTLQNMAIALAAIVFVAALAIPTVSSAALVVVIIVMIDIGMFGYMSFWHVKMNLVSMVNLVMSIGFSIDHTAHVIHAFTHCVGPTRLVRMRECLVVICTPVFHGAVSTWLACCCLATSDKEILVTFFKMMTLVLLFSVAHGVLLLPVLLSLIGPMPSNPSQIDEYLGMLRTPQQTELSLRDCCLFLGMRLWNRKARTATGEKALQQLET